MDKKFVPVQFEICKDDHKVVTANKYVPHALYVQNKTLLESLGGEIIKGVGCFKAQFSKVGNAKKFVKQAITEMPIEEYEATRTPKQPKMEKTTEPKSKKGATPKAAKKQTEVKAEPKQKPARKSKKQMEITPEQQRVIDKLNVSLWNRVAAAYDRANGGTGAVTFEKLGKSKKELGAYVPAGIASLRKSKHWAKAEAVGVTEDMLGKEAE